MAKLVRRHTSNVEILSSTLSEGIFFFRWRFFNFSIFQFLNFSIFQFFNFSISQFLNFSISQFLNFSNSKFKTENFKIHKIKIEKFKISVFENLRKFNECVCDIEMITASSGILYP
ncbi:hypothetical protein CANARDRAFT_169305 [[Candida] arabinofermentans NRRL YB-2248]|uniref:Uncharacterized protein n=1 Tax=[Candida] arabinofermentans NRRL YB-2248 TaxID=983967 RepID=A0A1E4SZR8_9ASCO|nr:hypothetical protein CANARDRAFT_169305 [[Candida] arabinofermentans NRRL YB-2248]